MVRFPSTLDAPGWKRSLTLAAGAVAAGSISVAVGAGLAQIAGRFGDNGPIVLLGLVVVPLLIVGILHDGRLAVLVVFATFPLSTVAIPTGFGDIQLVEVTVIAAAILVALQRLGTGRSALPWPSPLWWVLCLLAGAIVAVPSAADQELAFKQVATLIAGLTLCCVVVAACSNLSDVRRVLAGLVAVATGIAAGAFASGEQIVSTLGGARVRGRAVSSFDHSNQLGSLCALGALLALGLLLGARTRWGRIAAAGAMALLVGGQLLSLSRGAWIGTVVAVIFLVLVLPEARRLLLVVTAPLIAVAFLIGSFAPQTPQIQVIGERFQSLTVLSPYDARSEIWAEALRQIREDPLTGQGPGNFPVASSRSASETRTVYASHAHNILLNWTAEVGVPAGLMIVGLAVSLGIVVHRLRRRIASRNQKDHVLVAGMAAALVSVVAQGQVDYTLRSSVIFFAIWSVIGALLGPYYHRERPVIEAPAG